MWTAYEARVRLWFCSMGVVVWCASKMPFSFEISRMYIHWNKNISSGLWETSNTEKYLNTPKFFYMKQLLK